MLRRRKSSGKRLDFKSYQASYPLSQRLQRFVKENFYDDWQIKPRGLAS